MSRSSKNPLYIDWLKSEARYILLDDLEHEILSLDEKEVPVELAWGVYREHPAFKDIVCYDQFAKQLAAHRGQVKRRKDAMVEQLKAFQHDRELHKEATYNNRGEPVFALLPAKLLLRDDVTNKRHVGRTPTQLWLSRPEYQVVTRDKFAERIRQEIRYQKFVYYLNERREEKEKKITSKKGGG